MTIEDAQPADVREKLAHTLAFAFDVDGTLVEPKSGATFRDAPDDWRFVADRADVVRLIAAYDLPCALVTNQGGVAFGYTTRDDALAPLVAIARDVSVHHIYVSFFHEKARELPDGTDWKPRDDREAAWRKPGPLMLLEAAHDLGVAPSSLLFVGDMDSDRDAALAAGCLYCDASIFFAALAAIQAEAYEMLHKQLINHPEMRRLDKLPDFAGSTLWGAHYDRRWKKAQTYAEREQVMRSVLGNLNAIKAVCGE